MPEKDYAGTVTFACGSTDGAASMILLKGHAGHRKFLRVFVDGIGPRDLHGTIQTAANHPFPAVTITACARGGAASCATGSNPDSSGSIEISRGDGESLEGTLRFRNADGSWGEASFRAIQVAASPRVVCG